MKWFLLFGTSGFLVTCLLLLEIRYFTKRKNNQSVFSKYQTDVLFSALFAYAYAGYIFFIEGESNFIDPRESTLQSLRTGLPLYLFVYAFYMLVPFIIFLTYSAQDNQNKKRTKTVSKTKR
jgi:hypothetical protein